MVHCGILPRPRRHLNNQECCRHAQGAPRGAGLLVAGNFNVKLSEPEGNQKGDDIVAALAKEVLEDMSAHFLLHRR